MLSILTVQKIIERQRTIELYRSKAGTIHHKVCILNALLNLLQDDPENTIAYLNRIHYTRFHHKVFQEYVKLMEQKLPIQFNSGNKSYLIKNIMEKDLGIFDGKSVFDIEINGNNIKNKTQEFYIGGRTGAYCKPFYIGKLLNIIDLQNEKSIINKVSSYSFSQINLTEPVNTKIRISHLRIIPHYQMGGLTYISRLRKEISNTIKA